MPELQQDKFKDSLTNDEVELDVYNAYHHEIIYSVRKLSDAEQQFLEVFPSAMASKDYTKLSALYAEHLNLEYYDLLVAHWLS